MIVQSFAAYRVANTQRIVTSSASVQSNPVNATTAIVTVDALTFMIAGQNPTAVQNTCIPLLANQQYRVTGLQAGERLAFITASSGNAWVTPEG